MGAFEEIISGEMVVSLSRNSGDRTMSAGSDSLLLISTSMLLFMGQILLALLFERDALLNRRRFLSRVNRPFLLFLKEVNRNSPLLPTSSLTSSGDGDGEMDDECDDEEAELLLLFDLLLSIKGE